MKSRLGPMIWAVAFAIVPVAADACSPVKGYRVPSNFELVERADAIVLARVESAGKRTDYDDFTKARLVPLQLLKGGQLPSKIDFDDAVLSKGRMKATPSDPLNLVDANPQAFGGGCNRYIFDRGMILVAFLRRYNGRLVIDSSPFARTLEDVPSATALWVKTVRLYVSIASLPRSRQGAQLERQRRILAATRGDPDAPQLAQEIARTLRQRH